MIFFENWEVLNFQLALEEARSDHVQRKHVWHVWGFGGGIGWGGVGCRWVEVEALGMKWVLDYTRLRSSWHWDPFN